MREHIAVWSLAALVLRLVDPFLLQLLEVSTTLFYQRMTDQPFLLNYSENKALLSDFLFQSIEYPISIDDGDLKIKEIKIGNGT